VREFISCVREGREPATSPQRSLPVALAQAAIMESLRTRREVAVPS
jgi:hypothetical protein